MKDATLQRANLSATQRNVLDYFSTHDVRYVAEDALFREMSSGKEYRGRAEIGAMLQYFYKRAFDAKAEILQYTIDEDKAVIESLFKGKHIGEFAGIAATGKEVKVPLCISYSLRNGLIKEARIYMATDVLMAQLGVNASAPRTTFVIRDIFHLKYGHYKQVKALLEEALKQHLLPEAAHVRVLTDFTGKSYRLIFEEGYTSLAAYETSLAESLRSEAWQQWYELFKQHIESSEREILRQLM